MPPLCYQCDGEGFTPVVNGHGGGNCPRCGGSGKERNPTCHGCGAPAVNVPPTGNVDRDTGYVDHVSLCREYPDCMKEG